MNKKFFKKFFPIYRLSRIIFEKKLSDFSKQIEKNQKILDFASAGNKYSYLFKDHFFDGGDIIEYDNKEIFKNHTFKIDNLIINNFKKNYYDIVISTHSIERLRDYKNISISIKKLKQNMKKNGIFVTVFHNDNKYSNYMKEILSKEFIFLKIDRYNGIISQFSYFLFTNLNSKKIPNIFRFLLLCFYSILNRILLYLVVNIGDMHINKNYHEFCIAKKK